MRRIAVSACTLALLGAGVAAGWVAGRMQVGDPDLAVQGTPAVTVAVEVRALRDTLTAPAEVRYPHLGTVRGHGGTVTWMQAPGTVAGEGSVVAEVDLRPVIALAGERPMSRSLTFGLTGPDVLQLEEALDRLGFDPGPLDGRYTGSTRSAWHALVADHGYPPEGDVDVRDIAFLPRLPARLGTIAVAVGAPAEGTLVEVTEVSPVVTATVPGEGGSRLRVGMPAIVRAPSLADPREAAIAQVRPGPNGTEITLEGSLDGIEEAGSLRVTVDLADYGEDGLVVPVTALRTRTDGSVYVRVIRTSGADDVDVRVVAATGTEALVDASLEAGDEVDVGG
jgi:peptidoglycan hydrolase-like protein with peptidoglycan-binding domain